MPEGKGFRPGFPPPGPLKPPAVRKKQRPLRIGNSRFEDRFPPFPRFRGIAAGFPHRPGCRCQPDGGSVRSRRIHTARSGGGSCPEAAFGPSAPCRDREPGISRKYRNRTGIAPVRSGRRGRYAPPGCRCSSAAQSLARFPGMSALFRPPRG